LAQAILAQGSGTILPCIMASSRAAVTMLYGDFKFFFNEISAISDALPAVVAALRGTVAHDDHVDRDELDTISPMLPTISTALAAQRLISNAMGKHYSNLRDALFAVRKRLKSGTLKQLKNLNSANGYMKHYTDELDLAMLRKLRVELGLPPDPEDSEDSAGPGVEPIEGVCVTGDWKELPPASWQNIHERFPVRYREQALKKEIAQFRSEGRHADAREALFEWFRPHLCEALAADSPPARSWDVANSTGFSKDQFYDYVCDNLCGGSKDPRCKTVELLQSVAAAQRFYNQCNPYC